MSASFHAVHETVDDGGNDDDAAGVSDVLKLAILTMLTGLILAVVIQTLKL